MKALLGVVFALLAGTSLAAAEERYALIVSGAPGGAAYAGRPAEGDQASTRPHVERAIAHLKSVAHGDDLVLVVLIGHGTTDGGSAKFNLPGPDMTSTDWAALLHEMPGRLVFIDTTAASSPFLADLSARGRIVITATGSTAERYDTVFPAQLITALTDCSPPSTRSWTTTATASARTRLRSRRAMGRWPAPLISSATRPRRPGTRR